jgi:arylsulfatase A-like enzyme
MSNASRGFDELFFCNDPLAKGSLIPSSEEYERVKRGRLAELLEDWVRENIDKPLFVFIHTIEPHNPYETPLARRVDSRPASAETLALIRGEFSEPRPYPVLENPSEATLGTLRNLYRDAVRAAADYFAEIETQLAGSGLLDPGSLLILTADHGERLYEHGTWIHGPPDVYEEVLRVPLMLRGPGVPAGTFTEPVQLLDLYPTIVDWLGDPPVPSQPGASLLRVTGGEAATGAAARAIYADGTGPLQYACIWGHIKVIVNGLDTEVYDLENDRFETRNLAGDRKYDKYISCAKAFRGRFKRNAEESTRRVGAEEMERLRSLGYLK